MPTILQNKPLLIAAALLLAVLATWGSRERTWTKTTEATTKTIETLTTEKKTAVDAKTALETQMKSDSEETEELIPMQFPDGTVAMITRRSKRTLQEAITKATTESSTRIAELEHRVAELTSTSKTAETETTKNAPRWAAQIEIPILNSGDITAYRAGAGFNLGALTVGVLNPTAAIFQPYLTTQLRF